MCFEHGSVITSHSFLWDPLIDTCSWCQCPHIFIGTQVAACYHLNEVLDFYPIFWMNMATANIMNGPGGYIWPKIVFSNVFWTFNHITIHHPAITFAALETSLTNFYPAALKGSGVLSYHERAGGRQGRQAPLTLSRPYFFTDHFQT